jgi:hypothetical protein
MEQISSGEGNRFSTSQEIPSNLWKHNVLYRIHKRPLPLRILSQLDPVTQFTEKALEKVKIYLFKNCLNKM